MQFGAAKHVCRRLQVLRMLHGSAMTKGGTNASSAKAAARAQVDLGLGFGG